MGFPGREGGQGADPPIICPLPIELTAKAVTSMEIPQSVEDLLEAALAEEIGILVKTDSPDTLRRKLYRVLKEAKDRGDLRFTEIMISSGVTKDELLIRKKNKE